MNGALKGLIAFILIIGLLAGGVYIYYATEKNATFRKDEVVDVEIKQGSSASTIASVLAENDVIGSKYVFRFYIRGKDIVFQYGTFHLNRKMNYDELIEQLTTQQVVRETTDITIKEGMNAEQIISMLEELGIGTRDEILYAINEAEYDFDFITPDMTLVDYRLEGYLYPDTYEIYLDDSPEEVIVRLLDNFDKKTANLREEVAMNGGNFHETMILASIIEKEGQKESELPIVSSVFHNRLEQGMKLESCATVQYVLPEHKEVLSYEDTQTDSPFNTYIHPGLPPAPISNPGIAAIRAAIYPDETDYLFFVARPDGSHYFGKTYAEHEANIRKADEEAERLAAENED